MRRLVVLSVLLAACAGNPKPRADIGITRDTVSATYLSGGIRTPNWHNATERPYGRLVLADTALAMESDGGTLLFVLPYRAVTDASASVEQRTATVITGRYELLTIRTTTPDALVFRMRRDFSAEAAATKINARVRR